MRLFVLLCLFFLSVLGVLGEEEGEDYEYDEVYKEALTFVHECESRELTLCLKERALQHLNMLPENIDLGGVIKIKENADYRAGKTNFEEAIVLPDEPRARENEIDNVLFHRVVDYLSTHTIEFKMPSETMETFQRSIVEGRKKKNKGGGGNTGNMMMMLLMKAAILGAIAVKTIAIIAVKALLVAKIAFTISVIIALKKLLEHKHTSTYEVVAHPHYEEHGHYDRSFNQQFAYSAQIPEHAKIV